MVSCIDERHTQYGVERICKQLPIAPSVYTEREEARAKFSPAVRIAASGVVYLNR